MTLAFVLKSLRAGIWSSCVRDCKVNYITTKICCIISSSHKTFIGDRDGVTPSNLIVVVLVVTLPIPPNQGGIPNPTSILQEPASQGGGWAEFCNPP